VPRLPSHAPDQIPARALCSLRDANAVQERTLRRLWTPHAYRRARVVRTVSSAPHGTMSLMRRRSRASPGAEPVLALPPTLCNHRHVLRGLRPARASPSPGDVLSLQDPRPRLAVRVRRAPRRPAQGAARVV
jgi:hypothetical protein